MTISSQASHGAGRLVSLMRSAAPTVLPRAAVDTLNCYLTTDLADQHSCPLAAICTPCQAHQV